MLDATSPDEGYFIHLCTMNDVKCNDNDVDYYLHIMEYYLHNFGNVHPYLIDGR